MKYEHALYVKLDEPKRDYCPGDTLSGSVELAPGHNSDEGLLEVATFWQTSGAGDQDSGIARTAAVPAGRFIERGRQYAFRIEAPEFPMTYEGKLVSIQWHVSARITTSRRDKLLGKTPFRLVPRET